MEVNSGFRRRALVVALAGIYGMGSQWAHANPTGAQVANGQAVLQAQGNKLTVTNTPGAIINWQSFSVGAGETTYFQQQNAASAVLNRVQAQNPSLKSQIDGTLGSNGRVFLINPNGIVFGAGSVVDTQGFVASTLNLNDADFKSGKLKFSSQATAAGIEAKGRISSGNGDVYLVAPNIGVDGNAVITSDGGNIVLAAGEMVEITGRNLNDITFAVQSRDNQVINLGTLSGGAVGVFAGTLSHSGVIRAQTLTNEGGRLVLKAQGDLTLAAGSETLAEGNASAGTISIESLAGNITLAGNSRVSAASPTARGGDVSVLAGSGIVSIERDAAVSADGGSGGSIGLHAAKLAQDGAVHADGRSSLGGSISLQGDSRVIQSGSASVSAQGVVQGGEIKLAVDPDAAGSGYLFTSATINASAGSGIGGDVTITGRELNFAAARVVANGDTGGGVVRIGGGNAGQDPRVPNATNVFANAASSFEASARLNGNGGNLVVWSDGVTRFAGIAEARGGANSGNGGAIEISGKEETQLGSVPNASAPHGNGGTFLLDPKYIRIQTPTAVAGVSVELIDPNPGSGDLFGQNLYVLSNGNILVLKPTDNFAGPLSNSGAVYLFDGTTGSLISQLRGSSPGDQVGSNYTTLSSGKLAVFSPNWSNGAASSAGAITWFDIATGASGLVSAANSLVGGSTNDKVGNSGLTLLGGNKYYSATTAWNNSAGAITWIDAVAPTVGAITSANSFVGSAAGDRLGSGGVVTLPSGNYLIKSPFYNSSVASGAAGAVTWSDSTGVTGTVGAETHGNSIFGAARGDSVGSGGIVFLDYNNYYPYARGNFVVVSPDANGGAGAVTLANQNSGFTGAGVVSTNNSLVGTAAGDHLGSAGILPLYNQADPAHSNYLIRSPSYGASAGAVTWASGIAAIRGHVGAEINGNSVFGNAPGDAVGAGSGGIQTLDNYNFVVVSPNATSSGGLVAGVGAVSFGDQSSGFSALYAGGISASNSLVGATLNDHVGSGGITNLSLGNYVVLSPNWSGSTLSSNLGAVTWGSGTSGVTGSIATINSLVGSSSNDHIGNGGVTQLQSGNYLITSSSFGGGAGAVTWASSAGAIKGAIGSEVNGNSIYGSTSADNVGSAGIRQLNNGNFVVFSPNLFNGFAGAGALTWGNGNSGFSASSGVSSINSLVGTHLNDHVGANPGSNFFDKSNYYLLRTPGWNSSAGAVTFSGGAAAITGNLSAANSLVGSTANDNVGSTITFLPNGSYVVQSPNWDTVTSQTNAGAVTYGNSLSGVSGFITSANSLIGTYSNDQIGNGGLLLLPQSGAYLILSPNYNGGAGAVTWADGSQAINGVIGGVSAAIHGNSIFGNFSADAVGANSGVVQFLDYSNSYYNYGNFVVLSTNAANGSFTMAGAATLGSQTTGFASPGGVSSNNSLMGSHTGDRIGSSGIQRLYNPTDYSHPNFLIKSPNYNGGSQALTWASGINAVSGTIGSETNGNSITGNVLADNLGSGGIQTLNNYNFVVVSPDMTGNTGAVTFGNQASGFTNPGVVSSNNSLVGTNPGDRIGGAGLTLLYNNSNYLLSNYLIKSPSYAGGAGAATWASGSSAITGTIGSESNGNSVYGNAATDGVGSSIQTLNNGNFVVLASNAANSAASVAGAGAVIFGTQGEGFASPGALSTNNSLLGSNTNDHVGSGFIQNLSNGEFAIFSPTWNNNMGAISWGSDTVGITGVVSSGNSLVGSTGGTVSTGDRVGNSNLQYFGNGFYVRNAQWSSGAGAISYIDTSAPTVGVISAANSLVGSTAGDSIGSLNIVQIGSNKIAVFSPNWDNGAAVDAGAVTWLDSSAPRFGFTGTVLATNSLVGSSANDQVGSGGYAFVNNSLYAVKSSLWDNNGVSNAGALTWFSPAGTLPTGAVSASNSLVGSSAGDLVGGSASFTQGDGYVVVRNAAWNGNRSAVTWMGAGAPITGVISSQNSLIGANPNDLIGSGGIYANSSYYLANGDYIVSSPLFGGSGVGALTIGAKSGGISGVVSTSNSLVGLGTSFQFVNNRTRLLVAAPTADSRGLVNNGQICLYAGGAGCNSVIPSSLPQDYGTSPSASITITPDQITAITNNGTSVRLQANSDITLEALSDIISNNPSGNGGDLTLQAGRSVLIKSKIITDNGNLIIIGNDRSTNATTGLGTTRLPSAVSTDSVSAPDRDPGIAEITMADGTLLNTGNGNVTIHLRDGLGRSGAQAAAGDISLRSITAANLSVINDLGGIRVGSPAATAPSDIVIAQNATLTAATSIGFFGGPAGAFAQLAAKGTLAISPTPMLVNGGSYARIVQPSSGAGSDVLDTITAGLLSLNPNLLDQIEDTKRSKGEIEIEGGETCK